MLADSKIQDKHRRATSRQSHTGVHAPGDMRLMFHKISTQNRHPERGGYCFTWTYMSLCLMCQDRIYNLEAEWSRNRQKDSILTEGKPRLDVKIGYKQSPQSMRRNRSPVKLVDGLLLLCHEYVPGALVEVMEIA